MQAYNYLYFLGTEEYLTDNHPPTASWCIKTRVIRVKLRSVVPHLPTPRQPPPKMDSSRPSDRTALPKKKPLRLQNIQQTRLRSRSLWPRTIQQRESSQVRGFIFCASRDEQTDPPDTPFGCTLAVYPYHFEQDLPRNEFQGYNMRPCFQFTETSQKGHMSYNLSIYDTVIKLVMKNK